MQRAMNKEMIRKIDSVLDRVKEPESNLSVAQLGIVEKFRYNESKRTLYVYTKTYSTHKECCFLITKLLETKVLAQMEEELKKKLPDLAIRFINTWSQRWDALYGAYFSRNP